MRCVSYTQTASCYKGSEIEAISVADQNEHIKEYTGGRSLRLMKKYSVRKAAPEHFDAFEKMREDGLNRSFDILVIDSMWQCGKDMYQAIRILRDSFYPAGIEFAVVQEGFCTLDHSRNEVGEFFQEMWHRYSSHEAKIRYSRNHAKIFKEIYGYRYDREKDRFEIDEETAAIVREIFGKLLEGKKPSDIGRELSERQEENPGDYFCRTKGWKLKGSNRCWNEGTVYHLAKNPQYAGRWGFETDWENYANDCEPIIDPVIFDQVQKLFTKRRHHTLECNRTKNPLMKMITDDETGASVILRKNRHTGAYEYRFKPPKPEGADYEKCHIEYHEMLDMVSAELKEEKEKALAAASVIDSDEGQRYMGRLLDDARQKADGLLHDIYNRIKDEPECSEAASISFEAECIDGICKEIENIKTAFSAENPWIKLFSSYDGSADLTRSYLRKFTYHVGLYRFEKVRLEICESAWKERIPYRWLEREI